MLIAKCDKCEAEETIALSHVNPPNWSSVIITGTIPTPKGGLNRQSFRMILCGKCTGLIFDLEAEPKKSMQEQFRDVAADYLEELAIEIAERAEDM